jgi:hypothetical protein
MERLIQSNILTSTGFASSTAATIVNLDHAKGCCITASYVNTTPGAGVDFEPTDVTVLTGIVHEVGHGFVTGLKGQLSTVTTLPAGWNLITDYFIIRVDADNYKIASSLVNALAGTPVIPTDQGTGTHTFTATAIAGGSVKLQFSINGTDYVDVTSSSVSITATGSTYWHIVDPMYQFLKVLFSLTAGQLSATVNVQVNGELV